MFVKNRVLIHRDEPCKIGISHQDAEKLNVAGVSIQPPVTEKKKKRKKSVSVVNMGESIGNKAPVVRKAPNLAQLNTVTGPL